MSLSKSTRRTVFQSVIVSLLSIVMLALLSACASAPPKPDPVDMQITATADVNPDMQGRPSPVILHIIELSSTEQFNRLDYMGLTQPSGAGLGADAPGLEGVFIPGIERWVLSGKSAGDCGCGHRRL
jgi:type VI secretion system protein VasD